MIWILANWRLLVMGGCLLTGWYSHTVWDGYMNEKSANEKIVSIGKAETELVKANQNFVKAKADAKDPCISSPIAPGVLKLLK